MYTGFWITFPFDKIEAESPAGSFDDTNFYEYTVPVDGTYKVTLCMLSPATNPNAEFRIDVFKCNHWCSHNLQSRLDFLE